jgi:RHS repeat-associated protein
VKTWSMTWDPTRPNGEVLSWQSAGQRTSFLYGNERAASMNSSGLQSYEYNPLGDIVAGRAGTVESTGYAPYGKGETLNATVEPRFGYRGEIQIGNRVHLRARDLNTATARFDRKDPLAGIPGETVETNQYHYANNDPVGFEDPTGLQPTDQTFAPPKRKAIHVLGVKEVCDGFFGTIGCIAGDVAGGVKDAVTGPVKLVYRGGIAVWETPGAVYDCVKAAGVASCGGAAAKGFGTGIYDATVGAAAQLGRDSVNNPHKALRNAVTIAVTMKAVKSLKGRAGAVKTPLIPPGAAYDGVGAYNCASCAIAGDSTLAGRPASPVDLYPAAPSPNAIVAIETYAGAAFRAVSGRVAIEAELAAAGNGARGIVYGSNLAGEAHVWNAAVVNGKVTYFDFQNLGSQGAAIFNGWTDFFFVRTA